MQTILLVETEVAHGVMVPPEEYARTRRVKCEGLYNRHTSSLETSIDVATNLKPILHHYTGL